MLNPMALSVWPYGPLLWRYSEKRVESPPTIPTKLTENLNISMSRCANRNLFGRNSSQDFPRQFIPYKCHDQPAIFAVVGGRVDKVDHGVPGGQLDFAGETSIVPPKSVAKL